MSGNNKCQFSCSAYLQGDDQVLAFNLIYFFSGAGIRAGSLCRLALQNKNPEQGKPSHPSNPYLSPLEPLNHGTSEHTLCFVPIPILYPE